MIDFHYEMKGARRKAFRVQGDVCSIGSARNNDLVLDGRAVGKRHAELRMRKDGVHIRDLGSLDGCWVNRKRVMEYGPLSSVDEVAVGAITIVLRKTIVDEIGTKSIKGKNGVVVGLADEGTLADRASLDSMDDVQTSPASDFSNDTVDNVQSTGGTSEKRSFFSRFERGNRKSASVAVEAAYVEQASFKNISVDLASVIEPDDAVEPSHSDVPAPSDVDDFSRHDVLPEEHDSDPERDQYDEQLAYWASVIHEQLLYQMDLRRKDVNRMSDEELRLESTALIDSIINKLDTQLPEDFDLEELKQNVLNEAVGLGPLQQFLDDDEVTEIMVNSFDEIYLERGGKLERSRFRFSSDRTVYSVIERIITPLGRRIDESSPIVDARLKDGSRVNAVIPPLALKGPSMTIRKFPKNRLQFTDLLRYGSTSSSMVDFLRVCVEMRKNIIVAGGTGSGKTTLLNVLSNFIPVADRVVTIEDAAELKLVQPNLVALEARPPNLEGKGAVPIRDLVKNSLRMRPDRIVVGECRGGEALDMLQAMNTGHDGSLTTIHANSPRDVISRLEVLVLMAGMELPVSAIREQVASAVDIIIQQTRFHCGSRKISRVTEVVGVESGTVQLQDIFIYDQTGVDEEGRVVGTFRATGAIPSFYEELRSIGIEVNLDAFTEGAVL